MRREGAITLLKARLETDTKLLHSAVKTFNNCVAYTNMFGVVAEATASALHEEGAGMSATGGADDMPGGGEDEDDEDDVEGLDDVIL
jgi:hypothetical protein